MYFPAEGGTDAADVVPDRVWERGTGASSDSYVVFGR